MRGAEITPVEQLVCGHKPARDNHSLWKLKPTYLSSETLIEFIQIAIDLFLRYILNFSQFLALTSVGNVTLRVTNTSSPVSNYFNEFNKLM